MKIYMMTTQDKYELPLAIADSVRELSKLTGVPAKTITQALSHRKYCGGGKGNSHVKSKWHKIEFDGEID